MTKDKHVYINGYAIASKVINNPGFYLAFGFINEQGEEICEFKYDGVFDFNNGFACVVLNDKYWFINTNGKEICEIKYDFVSDFESIFAIAELNSKYGIINNYGHEVCEFKYSENEIYDIFKKYIKKYIKNHNRNLKLNQLV